MAISLGAMIQAARSQENPAGDLIANYQNQQDREKAEQQRQINNLGALLGLARAGGLNGIDQRAIMNDMGYGKYFVGG